MVSSDAGELPTMLQAVKDNLGALPKQALADTGYKAEAVFEALADPVLVVSGGEADDFAGRRVVLANRAARDLLRIQREGALLVGIHIRLGGGLEGVVIAWADETAHGGAVQALIGQRHPLLQQVQHALAEVALDP